MGREEKSNNVLMRVRVCRKNSSLCETMKNGVTKKDEILTSSEFPSFLSFQHRIWMKMWKMQRWKISHTDNDATPGRCWFLLQSPPEFDFQGANLNLETGLSSKSSKDKEILQKLIGKPVFFWDSFCSSLKQFCYHIHWGSSFTLSIILILCFWYHLKSER